MAHFPTNEFTPLALWWLGSYYFKDPTWLDAERYFKLILDDTNLPPWAWELKYQARMMAGRAALATRANWPDAITHFLGLINDTNCPANLRFQAMFAYGDTLISQDSTNRVEDYAIAIKVFRSICRDYPTNRQVFLAYGQEANCQLQWAALTHQPEGLTNALAAYQQVITSTNADASARSMAQVGQGAVLEKMAEPLKTGSERKALLEAALSKYLGVFYGTNLFQGERADPFWIQRAALEAARLVRTPELQNHRQEIYLLERLKKRLPVLGPSLDSSIIKAGK